MRGPIDYIIVGFENQKFDGSILKAVAGAIDSGAIALVDLSVIAKDADANVSVLNVAEFGDDYAVEFYEQYQPKDDDVSDEDIEEMADLLENNTAAGLLVVEQLWAKPLKKALIESNGVLIAEGRIHPDAAAELSEEL